MHLSSSEIPEDESEFEKAGLTQAPATLVQHPRIARGSRLARVPAVRAASDFGPEREMVVGEILLVHARDGIIDPATKRISEEHYRPIGRLFAKRYCTTRSGSTCRASSLVRQNGDSHHFLIF